MHLALGNVGADSRGCHGVKEDSLLDPGGCFFLSLNVCTQPRRCVCGGAVSLGGSVDRAPMPEEGALSCAGQCPGEPGLNIAGLDIRICPVWQ